VEVEERSIAFPPRPPVGHTDITCSSCNRSSTPSATRCSGRGPPSDAREVVEDLAINPNTVLKAYRELESEGFVHSGREGRHVRVEDRPGSARALGARAASPEPRPLAHACPCRRLDRESVIALFTLALQDAYGSEDSHARSS